MNAAKTRVQFVLHFGPQPGATNFHMYFAPYAEWYEKVDRHETGDGPLQHPAALAVPLGTMLSFTWIKTRSHDDQGMGSSNRLPIDQIQRVIYTTRAGRAGLLLPKWTKTLQ